MSSAWGNSWGFAWGNAWGNVITPVQIIDRGALGPQKKKKKHEVEQIEESGYIIVPEVIAKNEYPDFDIEKTREILLKIEKQRELEDDDEEAILLFL